MPFDEPRATARRTHHHAVAARLSAVDDIELAALLASARPLGSGIGGSSALLDLPDGKVFVKRIPLTAIEARHPRSTADLFGLPVFYQYGIGSAGFGAWRELAAHEAATEWVLTGEHAGFPLLHHWRVLPGAAGAVGDHDLEESVAHWGGSAAIRERLTAIAASQLSLVVFLEYVPRSLSAWLPEQPPEAFARIERELADTAAFLRERGWIHFDAHYGNVVTDGHRCHLTDFGLAVGAGFDLSPAERAFFDAHRDYDLAYGAAHLVEHHIAERYRGELDRMAFVTAWAAGTRPPEVPGTVADILDRHARTTIVMAGFFRELIEGDKSAPYPAADLARAIASPGCA
ncbi:hypothetical protein AB0I28_24150 [Phytomonospora sp. NPDC050363]|uniref:hypothetical protein n=1 Tax=Phytomonospora sp. NPDC050363 TaxID=3155642 RepID=UPI0033E0A67D